jgi:23S rRNA pseudouridine2605 synthase
MNSRKKPTGGRSGNNSKKRPLSTGKGRTGKQGLSKVEKGKQRFSDFKEKKKKGDPLPSFNENEIRLNKYLSNAGICSRREADMLIKTGVVKVNGEIITEMGYKVKPGDQVRYDGETINAETKRYVLLNKPKGFITTMDDPMGRKTVMGLVRKACKERVYPVGRLDRDTTGLLLFTNDGDLAKKLTHPRFKAGKIYEVELDKNVTSVHLKQLTAGIKLEDGTTQFDAAEFLSNDDAKTVGVELHSGKNQIVRRTFESLGYKVRKLDRVTFASLTKRDLPRGRYRHLTEKEVAFLKMTPNA